MPDDAKTRLLQAAGPVFADKGFQAATVREICELAGVNVASINYYFGDKERLYVEAVKEARRIKADRTPFPDWPADVAPETRLRQFVETLLTRLLSADAVPWPTRLMMREILDPGSACKELAQEYFRPEFEMLLGILDEMLPPDTPDYRRRQLGFSVVGQCVFYRLAGGVVSALVDEEELSERYDAEDLANHITRFTLAALGRTPPLGRQPSPPAKLRDIVPQESEN
ncbi:MAG: CerR family C-terminal domain-containing protein [Planctomycetes bacterium]|nr:CerR family C-terminal domain-containing protein [Planctomycetota bacterium]